MAVGLTMRRSARHPAATLVGEARRPLPTNVPALTLPPTTAATTARESLPWCRQRPATPKNAPVSGGVVGGVGVVVGGGGDGGGSVDCGGGRSADCGGGDGSLPWRRQRPATPKSSQVSGVCWWWCCRCCYSITG